MKSKTLASSLIVCLPLLLWCGGHVHQGHFNALILSAYFICACYTQNKYITIFCVYAGMWALIPMLMVHQFAPTFMEGCLCILLGLIVYYFILVSEISKETILDLICISALLQATLSLMQYVGFDPVSTTIKCFMPVESRDVSFSTPVGTLGNPNFLASYLAISLPFFIRKRWEKAIPILCAALLVTKTTTAVVAAIAGVGVYFFGWYGGLIGLACGSFILTGFAALKPFKFQGVYERLSMWQGAIRATSSSWQTFLLGWGPNVMLEKPNNMLHSEYIITFFNFGLTGISCLTAFIIDVLRKHTWKGNALIASFVAILVNMLGNHPLHTVPTAILIITVVALLQRELTDGTGFCRSTS
jgi:hypothetical protein